jgi:riboflavin synthase
MFTGLIEETGIVKSKIPQGKGLRFVFGASKVFEDLQIGSSININGACQTVVEIKRKTFSVDTIEETLKKTTFGELKIGDKVNLERPLRADSRLGGHFVLGHVDTTGKILEIKKLSASYEIKISFPVSFSNYLIPVGSIAVDGISLTLAEVKKDNFMVAIIPHTWTETVISAKKAGDIVNLEFDVLGKYIAKMMGKDSGSKITAEWLKKNGF